MIALALSVLAAGYLLIPNAWYRFLLSHFVPLKIFQERKTEDIARAVATLGLLFVVSLLAVWYLPVLRDYPFTFPETRHLRASDYKVVVSCLYSEELFKTQGDGFWDAFWRVAKRQGHFACWYYSLVTVCALLAGVMSRYYGRLSRVDDDLSQQESGLRRRIKVAAVKSYKMFSDFYLLPHVSQWYVVLTAFTFPDPKNTIVKADVLMTDGTLYRGIVADHFLDKDGNLAGLFLEKPSRYDRRAQLRERDSWGTSRESKAYLRPIPSAKLYLVADKIVNLNLNFEPPIAIADIVQRFVAALRRSPISVSVSSGTALPKE